MRHIRDTATKAMGAITIAATAAGGALAATLRAAINRADEMRDMAQAAGTTTEALSQLAFAGRQSGVEVEKIVKALAKLSAAGVGNAPAAFKALADEFERMPDGAIKTARAIEIFGERIGPELIPLLNLGSRGLAELADQADRLGITIRTSAANAADQFNDRLGELKGTLTGFGNALAAELLPSLQAVADELATSVGDIRQYNRAVDAAAGFLRGLVIVALGAVTAFEMLGRTIGARAAQLDALRKFNFREAMFIGGELDADLKARAEAFHRLKEAILETTETMSLAERRMAAISRGGGSGVLARGELPDFGPQNKAKEDDGLGDVTVWQRRIFNFANESQEALAELSRESVEESRKFLQQIGNDSFEITRDVGKWFTEMGEEARRALSGMTVFAEQAGRNIQDAFATFLFDPFKGGLNDMLGSFVDTIRRMVAELAASELLRMFFTWGSGLGGGVGSFFGKMLGGLSTRAIGGPVMAGSPYLVGERGPELFVPRSSGTIVPNGAGGVVLNQSIHLDARGGDADKIMAALPAWGRAIKAATVAEVRDLIARGKLA